MKLYHQPSPDIAEPVMARRLWVTMLLIYLYFSTTYTGGDMPNSILSLTASLMENQRLSIGAYAATSVDVSIHDGQFYSGMAPGVSVLAIPGYWLARSCLWLMPGKLENWCRRHLDRLKERTTEPRHLVHAPDPLFFLIFCTVCNLGALLLCATVAPLVYLLLRHYGMGQAPSLLLALSCGLGTPCFGYCGLYTQTVAVCCLVWGYSILLYAYTQSKSGYFLLGGLLVGLAGCCDYHCWIYAGGIALLFGIQSGWPKSFRLLIGLAIPALLLGWYHQAAFGHFLATPYHFREGSVAVLLQQGLMGLSLPTSSQIIHRLFSMRDGLIVTCLPLLLWPVWSYAGCRQRGYRLEVLTWSYIIAMDSLYILAMGWAVSTDAGVGARYFIPAIPFAILGLVCLPKNMYSWLLPLTIAGIGWHWFGNAIGPHYLTDPTRWLAVLQSQGLSSFVWCNVAQHFVVLPPIVVSAITIGYCGACLAWVVVYLRQHELNSSK